MWLSKLREKRGRCKDWRKFVIDLICIIDYENVKWYNYKITKLFLLL